MNVISKSVIALLLFSTLGAQAQLADAVKQFFIDYDKMLADQAQLAVDRDGFAAAAGNENTLRAQIKPFFIHRQALKDSKTFLLADRQVLKLTLEYKGVKLAKIAPRRKDLALDAASYLDQYELWVRLKATIDADLQRMRDALAAGDNKALREATKAYFDDGRTRLHARLQWQSDLLAMQKDAGYKPPKTVVQLPPLLDVSGDVAEYLADRAQWLALGEQISADRNNIRAALSDAASLSSAVTTFFNDLHARRVKGLELYQDRNFMGTDVGIIPRDPKKLPFFSANTIDTEDEDENLDLSSDEAGIK